MVKLQDLNRIDGIKKIIDEYNEDDLGLVKYIKSRDDMFIYMDAITQAAYFC